MQTLILGFDAFDPTIFERLSEQGKVPNLTRYAASGGYARFSVVNPPQTEVSWTSIATGLDPGGHAVFDFVHRDPASYTPYVSMLPTKSGAFGTQFVPPYKTRTIFEEATRQGFPATALWWPATFPARPDLPVRTLPGLGTPDIQGRWGVGTLLSSDPQPIGEKHKTSLVQLDRRAESRYTGLLAGPIRKKGSGSEQAAVRLELELTSDKSARLRIDGRSIELVEGEWSPILEISFKMGRLLRVHALTRVVLVQARPDVRLYALPLQIHPLHSPWRYATPGSFVKEMWKAFGPFLTLGWPQDTTGLEDGCITDSQFLSLCESIFDVRERILMHQLQHFDEGILASIFDSMDRVQHMFRRDRPDIVDTWYMKLDALVGRVEERLAREGKTNAKMLIISDHGFSDFDYKAHVNRWLIEGGYLAATDNNGSGGLKGVDWSRTQAYAVGLNSVYLNLMGREGQGSVQPDQVDPLMNRLRDELLAWLGPDGHRVVQSVLRREDAFHGPFAEHGPDLVVGYSPGYRASAETGLGQWEETVVETNHDHWGADHCVDSHSVPGVVFCNQGLDSFPNPSYRDIPALAIESMLDPGNSAPPPSFSEEDEDVLEERLRSLGYL